MEDLHLDIFPEGLSIIFAHFRLHTSRDYYVPSSSIGEFLGFGRCVYFGRLGGVLILGGWEVCRRGVFCTGIARQIFWIKIEHHFPSSANTQKRGLHVPPHAK